MSFKLTKMLETRKLLLFESHFFLKDTDNYRVMIFVKMNFP